jgi:hypothetical protein
MADSEKEFERFPKYYENYLRAFSRMLKERKKRGLSTNSEWASAEQVMRWWLGKSSNLDEDQLTILELGLNEDYFEEE